jgi:hypothetical protein
MEFLSLLDTVPVGEDEKLLELEDDDFGEISVRRDNPRNLLTCVGAENYISIVDAQFDS